MHRYELKNDSSNANQKGVENVVCKNLFRFVTKRQARSMIAVSSGFASDVAEPNLFKAKPSQEQIQNVTSLKVKPPISFYAR